MRLVYQLGAAKAWPNVVKSVTNPAITDLQLSFLGTPNVRFQENPLSFRSRKELALLIYLVVETGWHQRDHLIDLLWPDKDRKQGRMLLRSSLTRLRKPLAVAGDLILTEGDRVAFDHNYPFRLDIAQIEQALSAEATPQIKQAVLKNVQGAFLVGFSLADAPLFDDWVATQNQLWHGRLEQLWGEPHPALFGERGLSPALGYRWAMAPLHARE